MKERELLAGGIVRDYRYRNENVYRNHLLSLDMAGHEYEVLERQACKDGTVLARIVVQYNNSPLIQLYDT